ncbi:hypothetical protein [Vibrio harveyi]|uniref:hypothetical protein n=1 Tax=Vibrio harveyi TaxID=669 RepID=UPI001A272EFA|nr:hypothetical protein [Vibrio harveyi]HAS6890716.1 hypothetical protein [Vibrio parahaemolyticus]
MNRGNDSFEVDFGRDKSRDELVLNEIVKLRSEVAELKMMLAKQNTQGKKNVLLALLSSYFVVALFVYVLLIK